MLYELNVDPRARPVKQKRRHFGLERNKTVAEETNKLLPARMIKEVQCSIWLSNPVMVKNDTGGGGCA